MIQSDKPHVFLQKVKVGSSNVLNFELTNTSKEPLVLSPHLTCGCTKAKLLPTDVIGVGEKATLEITFTPKDKGTVEREFGVNFKLNNQNYRLLLKVIAVVE